MKDTPAAAEHSHGSYGYRKDDLRMRLARIEGQVRGIGKMVEEEKYCVDILTQVAAVRAALDRVALGVLEDHMKGCVAGAVEQGDLSDKLAELQDVLARFVAMRR
jgi:DNA-binding FrmR family transcriptional regulator